ncbi:Bug family tripartite tricarboxylate transporter substrate binding protein [Pseudoroseomonas ludipueritiae]|uniref:Tripartite tricarboxylate transporter substrate binding protein n=1 Tax=Pseudoroseomonas ludipueritiae TaxID=198093 RepID=A0ABR7RDR2_9PROT|nr:tripartite tricarboxylate transporter substrate binding protein [Pseudoroseomonas ludipueritiae]MBC9180004.1 tripartite tricarboxylate transporter substrate binding protein [Pseudoroseomonas ludipueritiae]
MRNYFTRRQALRGAALLAGAASGSAALPGMASAQGAAWPNRPVRIVVPFPAGGTTDLLARVLAEPLQKHLGVPVVVENRAGAGGSVGADFVAKADADGYTFLMTTIGTAAINYELYKGSISYKAEDLAAVSNVANVPNVLTVASSSPIRTLQDLVASAKSKPGELTFGSSGNGSSLHLTGELLKAGAGIDLIHVPYRGSGPMLIDAIAGRVDLAIDNLPSSIGHINGGRLRAIAVTSPQRSPSLPDVPTVREAGLPSVETVAWFGVQAPVRTPRPIIDKVAAAIHTIVNEPVSRARIAEQGGEPVGDKPEEFQRLIDAEIKRWTAVIRQANVRVD